MKNKTGKFFNRSQYTYSVLLLSAVLITAFISYSLIIHSLNKEVIETNLSLLQQNQLSMDSLLSSINGNLASLISDQSVQEFMYDASDAEYERYANDIKLQNRLISATVSHPAIDSVYLYSARSGRIITNGTCVQQNDFHDMQWKSAVEPLKYQEILYYSRIMKTDYDINAKLNVLSVIQRYPILNSYSESSIVLNLDKSMLYSSINNIEMRSGEQFFVIDSNGLVILHNDSSKINSYFNNHRYYRKILAKDSGMLVDNINNVTSTVFYVTSPMTGWKFVRITPSSLLKNIMITNATVLLFVITVIFIFLILFLRFISPWIYKPIYSLVDRITEQIRLSASKGELAVAEEFDDIEHLEQTFYNIIETNSKNYEQIQKNIPLMKWKLICDILFGNKRDFAALSENFDFLNISLYPQNYLVLIAEVDHTDDDDEHSAILYTGALCRQAENYINDVSRGTAILQNDGQVIMLLSFETPDNWQNLTISAIELIKSFMNSYFGVTITIAVGGLVVDFSDIKNSYAQAKSTFRYKLVMGKNSVIWFDDTRIHNDTNIYKIISEINELEPFVQIADEENEKAIINRIFSLIEELTLPTESVIQVVAHLMVSISSFALDAGIDVNSMRDEFGDVYGKLSTLSSLEQMKNFVWNMLRYINSLFSEKKTKNSTAELTARVRMYLDENYMHPYISLAYVADIFYVSKQYLSKIFKDHCGIGFFDYLINLRIEQAKNLLKNDNIKITDVAEKVGYTNVHSFIKIFKKQLKMTPSQYRESYISKQ